ncbi:MAG: site-specific DNA-methyltransferase [Oscillospiraceae bacterium]|jgi:adenine-specific DNA-methyltransferase|nr:site-specific DNA-methyltransferase [Oscillospiraceae bacterium]
MSEKLNGFSMDIAAAEQEKLRAVFPQCFVEGRLDERKLLELLGTFDTLDENDREKYEFRWKGKQEALQLAGKRSAGTLRPVPQDSVDWESTRNLYIEGDNLEVLKLLQTSYYRKVKMIYIDPPYNTGNDFVYADDFADPLARYREVTQQTTKSNPESMGRFHTNWLNMMLPRLRLAANLLRDDGVIFISIDDHEIDNLKKLCNEIFGEENFVAQIVWQKKYAVSNDDPGIAAMHEYILVYQKSGEFKRNLLPRTEKQLVRYNNLDNDPRGDWSSDNYISNKSRWERPTLWYPTIHPKTGLEVWPDETAVWRYAREQHERMVTDNRLYWGPDQSYERPRIKRFLSEVQAGVVPATWWPFTEVGHNDEAVKETAELLGKKVFSTPKPIRLLKQILFLATAPKKDDIVLDFFSGSSAIVHAVMQLNAEDGGNRRFILVQLPEVCDENSEAAKAGYKTICEIGKERIRRAGKKILEEQAGLLGMVRDHQTRFGEITPLEPFAEFVNGEASLQRQAEISKRLDVGFRVFRLDSSNLKLWDDSPIVGEDKVEIFTQRLLGMLEILKPDRSDVDVVYEVMLKLGQDLCAPILQIELPESSCQLPEKRAVYGVCAVPPLETGNWQLGTNVKFIVCLALNITVEDAEIMAAYAPGRIVFADQCFVNSEAKSNVKLTLRDKGITIRVL